MHKTILIAGLVMAVTAGAALAQTPAPQAPAQRDGGPGAGPGFGHGGPGFGRGGPGGRRFMRHPPTPQEVQQRNAAMFARVDANKDGRITFEEFRQAAERRKLERQRRMFQRFTGQQDSVTLDQLNARSLERLTDRGRGRDGGRHDGGARRGPPAQPGQPAPPPPPR